jgi:hypothetical protein
MRKPLDQTDKVTKLSGTGTAVPTDTSEQGPPDDLITEDEAAADLKQKKSTLATWRSIGKGPDFWKLGRGIYYSRQANADWIAKQRRAPRTPPTEAPGAERANP